MLTSSHGYSRRFWWSAHAGFMLTGVVNTLLGPILPLLIARFGLSDARAGTLFTVQFAGSLAGVALSGRVVNLLGFGIALPAGYLMMAAGALGVAAGDWRLAVAGVFTWGLGFGIVIPASNLMVAAEREDGHTSGVIVLNMAWCVGAVASPPLLAVLLRTFNLGTLLAGLAALAAASAVATFEPRPMVHAGVATEHSASRAGFGHPVALLTSLVLYLYVGTEVAISGWVAAYAKRMDSAGAQLWTIAPAAFWMGVLLGRLVSVVALRRVSPVNLLSSAFLVGCVGIGALLAATSGPWVLAAVLLAGCGFAPVFPGVVAAFSGYFGREAARLSSMVFLAAGLGGASIPWLVGVVSTATGSLRAGLKLALVLCAAMGVAHRLIGVVSTRVNRRAEQETTAIRLP